MKPVNFIPNWIPHITVSRMPTTAVKSYINGVLGLDYATLPEIMSVLEQTYCGTIGVEFLHMSDPEEKMDSGTH